ncbi:IS1182 family transposase [Xenorhabdus koppenhoeferi]|uniref:Transposase n=1 Tax=Xenorhabdus koppenhoeferi TaxID=351659 RepID=A0A1I7I1R1_9GAMM|nr:IS1182 family transposase [Xenorhabdus koppenhoeferi]SFU66878.1 Transposase [Xenorhabdus koppenhoeferi]
MLRMPLPPTFPPETLSLDDLVPKNHLVRKVDAALDFEFIRDLVAPLYCHNNGRPAIDPVMLIKMMLLGYLFGVPSERRLVQEIQVNMAYRWFLRLGLTDKVPDASTLSQNRRRRFNHSDVFQQIFDHIVEQAIDKGFVGGRALYTDSTHLKASANPHKAENILRPVPPGAYLDELEKAVNEDRAQSGKKSLKPAHKERQRKTKVSTTDPESGFMHRTNKPKGFFYLDHRTVDGKANIILDTYATAGNVHDSQPLIGRLKRQLARFSLNPIALVLDAGYFTAPVCHLTLALGLTPVISYRRPNKGLNTFQKKQFIYDPQQDCYVCPQGEKRIYTTTGRQGYRYYRTAAGICQNCPLRAAYTRAKKGKTITRHIWETDKEKAREIRLSPWGKKVHKRRKETIERSFADAKQHHGHRYAHFRGLRKVQIQCLLAATAQNIKKIALLVAALYWFYLWFTRECIGAESQSCAGKRRIGDQ